jgi:hypothetical protein
MCASAWHAPRVPRGGTALTLLRGIAACVRSTPLVWRAIASAPVPRVSRQQGEQLFASAYARLLVQDLYVIVDCQ